MKKLFNWIYNNREKILKSIYSLPVLLSIVVSINHCFKWFEISNPPQWAWFLSISVEIVALTTLVALILGRNTFSIIFTFILISFVQIIGNVFFSFNQIDENGQLFQTWQKFIKIIFEEDWSIEKCKFWLAIISGSIVPMLSLLSLHLISSFKLKETNEKNEEKLKVLSTIKKNESQFEQPIPIIQTPTEIIEEKQENLNNEMIIEEEKIQQQVDNKEEGVKKNDTRNFYPSMPDIVKKDKKVDEIKKEELKSNKETTTVLPKIKINNKVNKT